MRPILKPPLIKLILVHTGPMPHLTAHVLPQTMMLSTNYLKVMIELQHPCQRGSRLLQMLVKDRERKVLFPTKKVKRKKEPFLSGN